MVKRLGLCLLPCVLLVGVALGQAGPTPAFYEGFDKGKLDGPVGKAGERLSMDGRGVVDLDRGTLAFFHQSKTDPKETEWDIIGGLDAGQDSGYWSMLAHFRLRRQEFGFDFYDIGFYAPPLRMPGIIGRWKAGQWHHLAAVWDRNEGVTVYEDGRRVNSNWGKHRWEWNLIPETLTLSGPVDEVYVFAEPLTDAQVAQLAKGEKPTGAPIPLTPAEARRPHDLARMGWSGASLANMPVVAPDAPLALTFARINRCVDAKRPVAYPYEGLLRTTWPSVKYGPSIRGQRLDISLDPGQRYDRVRAFIHRPFKGEFARLVDGQDRKAADLDAPQAGFWHGRFAEPLSDTSLTLKRTFGQLGQVDFYRAEPLPAGQGQAKVESYAFARTEAFPATEQGRALMGETPRRFWNPLAAVKAAPEAWTLETPAFGGFQATCEEPAEAKAYDGAVIELTAEGLTEPTPARVEVKEPVYPGRIWLAADVVLQPKAAGRQTWTLLLKGRPVINMPPLKAKKYLKDGKYSDELIPVPGLGFAVTLTAANAAKWAMGNGGCRVAFCVADMAAALPKAVDDQVEWMREAYAEGMEGHAYGWKRLVTPLKWLTVFAPDRMEARQMYERIGSPQWYKDIAVPKLVYEAPENKTGAPDWAFWQMEVVNRHRRHVHWHIDHNQVWTGEFGGVWNDDADHVENWMGYMLCLDGDGKIHDAMTRYWDGVWTHQLAEGVGKYTQDTCHFSEEGSSSLGMRLLVDYGDPVAYARTMAAVSHIQHWLAEDKDGGYVFKSMWTGPEGAWTEGAFLVNAKRFGHCYDVILPAGYLTWYNRHPVASKYILGLQPEGHGMLGPAYDRLKDWPAALKRYEELCVKPLGRYGPGDHIDAMNEVGLSDEARKAHTVAYSAAEPIAHYWGSRDTDVHWFRWKITGDIRFLVDSYKRVAEWFYSHDWLNSAAMPSMDRNPLPRGSMIRSRLGALVANRGSSGIVWPRHALSYTRGGDQVAALVTENVPNRFSARLYPFTDGPHPVQIRVWRCHGTFTVALANDRNDDGAPEETFWSKEMRLDRGAYVDFTLPPKQASILSVTPIQTEEPSYDKPDPAISPSSVELVYGDQLVVRVYNNGTRPVEDVLVRVRDGRSGEIVSSGEQHTGPIEAPLDLKPRYRTVEFKNVNCHTYGRIIIELDPEKKIDDLNPYNNTVVLGYRATYLPHGGWR